MDDLERKQAELFEQVGSCASFFVVLSLADLSCQARARMQAGTAGPEQAGAQDQGFSLVPWHDAATHSSLIDVY